MLRICSRDASNTTESAPIFVFAGTNREDLIDPAILERFTEKVEIPLPDAAARKQLLRNFIGRKIQFDLQECEKPTNEEEIEDMLATRDYKVIKHTDDNGLPGFSLWCQNKFLGTMESLSSVWDEVPNHDKVLHRLAQATNGMSGRTLKNLVTRAIKTANKRVLSDPKRRIKLRESDFELYQYLW